MRIHTVVGHTDSESHNTLETRTTPTIKQTDGKQIGTYRAELIVSVLHATAFRSIRFDFIKTHRARAGHKGGQGREGGRDGRVGGRGIMG